MKGLLISMQCYLERLSFLAKEMILMQKLSFHNATPGGSCCGSWQVRFLLWNGLSLMVIQGCEQGGGKVLQVCLLHPLCLFRLGLGIRQSPLQTQN